MLYQDEELDVLHQGPPPFLEVLVGIVLKPVIKVLETPAIEEVTYLVPVVTVDVMLLNEEGLFIQAKR